MRILRVMVMIGWLFVALSTAVAVTPAYAEEYIAFSLGVAQKRIETSGGTDWRKEQPEVFTLGGITKIRGLVYDRKTVDMILVGERDPKRPILTLDDLAVALRALFIYNQWPLVSIDPTPDTKKTNMQHVRYEGGIENTAFGLDMFDADLRLKKIAQGQLESGAVGLMSVWDMNIESMKRGEGNRGNREEQSCTRFWFYPVSSVPAVREDVVGIEELKVAVFAVVESLSVDGKPVDDVRSLVDPIKDKFVIDISERYPEVAAAHPSIARLVGLDELVALTQGIEAMDPKPDLIYWLEKYQVKGVATPKEQEVLKRRWDFGEGGFFEMSGGVHLTAIALRLQAGDVSALREATLTTRPDAQKLWWTFDTQWVIRSEQSDEIAPLFAHATFLRQQRRYDDAITLYDRILKLNPNLADAYGNRGNVYRDKQEYDRAIQDYDKVIAINPNLAEAYNNRGIAYKDKGLYDLAIQDYDKAIAINPNLADAYINRGVAYHDKGLYDCAIQDYDKAIAINPNNPEAYNNRGVYYNRKSLYDCAIQDFDKAIAINSNLADNQDLAQVYCNRGIAYNNKRDYDRAIQDYDKAIAINPNFADAYFNRGNAYCDKRDYALAIQNYDKAIAINPNLALFCKSKAYKVEEYKWYKAKETKIDMYWGEIGTRSSLNPSFSFSVFPFMFSHKLVGIKTAIFSFTISSFNGSFGSNFPLYLYFNPFWNKPLVHDTFVLLLWQPYLYTGGSAWVKPNKGIFWGGPGRIFEAGGGITVNPFGMLPYNLRAGYCYKSWKEKSGFYVEASISQSLSHF
ncbi:tetratricopeptide repeat protein [Candidatus Poribacteria bacterium]|nr:tetratricopeptide repeat protein [Candidatus Poribacteria bacterium]